MIGVCDENYVGRSISDDTHDFLIYKSVFGNC